MQKNRKPKTREEKRKKRKRKKERKKEKEKKRTKRKKNDWLQNNVCWSMCSLFLIYVAVADVLDSISTLTVVCGPYPSIRFLRSFHHVHELRWFGYSLPAVIPTLLFMSLPVGWCSWRLNLLSLSRVSPGDMHHGAAGNPPLGLAE